jgi:hypothetical protein
MTESPLVSIDEVRSLVAERQRYDEWLTALDGRRAETPSHVFDRVREDYVVRRDVVMGQLREHVGALSVFGDDLAKRLTAVESELATLEDERVEAMLRTAVGEYDDQRWGVVQKDVETQMAVLGAQRDGLLAEVDEVRMLLASADSEPPAAVVAVPVPDVPVLDVVSIVEPEPLSRDDLVFLVTPEELPAIVDTDTGEYAGDQAGNHARPQPPMFVDDVTSDFSADIASYSAADGEAVLPRNVGAGTEDTMAMFADTPEVADSGDVFDDLAFLRSVIEPTPPSAMAAVPSMPTSAPAKESPKTLRCTECSTMNLPTEWYCERCGGELTTF